MGRNALPLTWVWHNGGSSPQKQQYELGCYYPAGTLVEAATAPSPGTLGASGGRHSGGERLTANNGSDYREVATRK